MRRGALATALLALLLLPAAALAHKGKVTRSLFLEATDTHLVVLAHISVRGADRRRSLVTLADVNHSGRLEPAERRQLRDQLAASALSGLVLQVDGVKVTLHDAQSKLVMTEGRPIEVAVHGQLALPKAAKQVVLRTATELEGLDLRLLPGVRRLSSPRAKRGAKGLGEIAVGPGDQVRIEVARAR